MKYIRIDNSGVVNVISNVQFEGAIEIQDHVVIEIGMIYKNGVFTKTFEQEKQEKIEALNAYVNEKFTAYLAKYPEVEVQSFTKKATEASMVLADNATIMTLTPYLAALTNNDFTARNILAKNISDKVLENAQLEAFAVAIRDAIKACTTVEDLEKITW